MKKKAAIVLIVFALIGFVVRGLFGGKKSTQYQTATVEVGPIVSSVSASGQIQSSGNMPVVTQASGVVKSVLVKNDDAVKQGQKLIEFSLDQQGAQKQAAARAGYLSAKNTLNAAQATAYSLQSDMFSEWKTFKDLAESASYDTAEERTLPQFHIAEKDWLAAEAKYKNQQAVIAQAQTAVTSALTLYQLASSTVTAPIEGIVRDITVIAGVTLATSTAAQKVASVASDTPPIGLFNLSETNVGKVNPDDKTTITVDALPGKTFTGKVAGVDKTGVITSGVTNYPVSIQFDTANSEVLPNMSASANIIIAIKSDVLLVPSAAIRTQAGGSTVEVLKNGKVQTVVVETGLSSDTQTEIVSGLVEGDQIVTGALSNGSRQTGQSPFSTFRGFGGGGGGARMIQPH